MQVEKIFRIYDFNVYNEKEKEEEDENGEEFPSDDVNNIQEAGTIKRDTNQFYIQMFGINEKGKSCSIIVEGFKPFFYIKVGENWNTEIKNAFLNYIKRKIEYNPENNYYENSIHECKLIRRKKLYGFDGGKEHKFIELTFNNFNVFNKVKNLWYMPYIEGENRKLIVKGFMFQNTSTYLYESNIPPLLRFFHIKNISPSGWIALPINKLTQITNNKKTTCYYEYRINFKFIIALNEKETPVPLKICSFDIEASSSHGDFPVPFKTYKKLATNIIEYFEKYKKDITIEQSKKILTDIIFNAFGYDETMSQYIDKVYPIESPKNKEKLSTLIVQWLNCPIKNNKSEDFKIQQSIENMFEKMQQYEEDDEEVIEYYSKDNEPKELKKGTIIEIICDKKMNRTIKLNDLNESLNKHFPKLEGDKCTFIGSTFLRNGEKEPYLNHCVVLNSCSSVDGVEIQTCRTERELLLEWRNIIQKENPDIIIGYNIFGFDYQFLFSRAEENDCVEEFLSLSKNKKEICGTKDFKTRKYKLEQTSIQLASGQHDLNYIKMNGRIQIDLYNFFRREENLTSYKLDYVAGHFIGDYVKSFEYEKHIENDVETDITIIQSLNMTGLHVGSYIHFEEIGHSVEYYKEGIKFLILELDRAIGRFKIAGNITPDMSKKVRWCLAKDDVTPKDIFKMTNGSADDRSIIVKYCIQDCNLVHYLMNKVDIWTGYSEMAKICSVPINFLVLRGQGIKLTSYVAKKCREMRTLMPVMEKSSDNDGFEGAIVLDPKCDLYLDNPVACVDYASLYPSSMMSENISHDSKVWTKEYDLNGKLVRENGEKDILSGNFIYDNLPEYEYVDITYDTFVYRRKSPSAAAEKIKSGHKICRFAQFPEGKRAIMPSILEELLVARKTTRKMIPNETNEFMKNVLDKRQIGYKLTANSLYGQCGAKTSSFYEKDCAASTTATGRLLLIYAKKVVEECYGNTICDTENYGPVLTKAEYIYGDSVAKYTPIYVLVNSQFDICTIEELSNKYGNSNWVICKEIGKQDKEFCELTGVETWTESGWTKLHRIIRHKLASHKKMIRILTHTGLVDVTDDHSLIMKTGEEISPKDVNIGTELLYGSTPTVFSGVSYKEEKRFDLIMNNSYVNFDDHKEAAMYCLILSLLVIHYTININDGIIRFKIGFTPIVNKGTIKYIQEIPYEGYVYDLTTDNHHFAAGVGNIIVHNTDSVFFTFNLTTPEGEEIRGKKALEITIELAQQAGHLASKFLKGPHDLEYEKTFMPFCLLSKKRYVGMLYETDATKCKRKEMGIVLKRRDNAPIVKDIYGGIIDILMKQQDIGKAVGFLKESLRNIVDEKYSMDKLIISKSLRSGYKNPQQISHKVLADRMTQRDPGNKPGSGDRIPYVYIHNINKKALQGDRIETPTFIIENKLKIDYSFYITNQIMKPVQQVFALVLEKIWKMQKKNGKIAKFNKDVESLRDSTPEDKFEDKLEAMKNKEVKILLFDDFLRETNNRKENVKPLTSFFKGFKSP
jgi:DNA polymerase elongation subunit (family B)